MKRGIIITLIIGIGIISYAFFTNKGSELNNQTEANKEEINELGKTLFNVTLVNMMDDEYYMYSKKMYIKAI